MDYLTLSPTEKLSYARERLHGLEADHFRTAIVGDAMTEGDKLMQRDREPQIEALRKVVAGLEAAPGQEAPAASEPASA